MKNYIAPEMKVVMLDAEAEIMVAASDQETDLEGMMSNKRKPSASSTIWGFDDEAK